MTGTVYGFIPFSCDITGTLDCGTNKFSGMLENGVYTVGAMYMFAGPITADYDPVAASMVNGFWKVKEPNQQPPEPLVGEGSLERQLLTVAITPTATPRRGLGRACNGSRRNRCSPRPGDHFRSHRRRPLSKSRRCRSGVSNLHRVAHAAVEIVARDQIVDHIEGHRCELRTRAVTRAGAVGRS